MSNVSLGGIFLEWSLIRSRNSSFCSSVSFARLVKQETESESKYLISDFLTENNITSPSISSSSPLLSFLISQAKYRAANHTRQLKA